MENNIEGLKKLKIEPPSTNPTSGYISKGNEITLLKRYLHSCVHCSIIHNSQEMESTEVPPVDEWIKKRMCVCVYIYIYINIYTYIYI